VTIPSQAGRLYGDLARWWPLISPVEVYEEDARIAAELFALAGHPVREVLELASGGGHMAFHLRSHYAMTLTLVDLSPEMLAVSRELNPGAEHLLGDMRDVRLGRAFDAVLVHDAIDYMTTPHDLSAALHTAFEHCRPGGVAVFFPDHVADTFEPVTDCGGSDADDGSGVRYLEWSQQPEPGATTVRTEYTFTIKETDGDRPHRARDTRHRPVHGRRLAAAARWGRLPGLHGARERWARARHVRRTPADGRFRHQRRAFRFLTCRALIRMTFRSSAPVAPRRTPRRQAPGGHCQRWHPPARRGSPRSRRRAAPPR
jgi:SAM-dependent methyltransferase